MDKHKPNNTPFERLPKDTSHRVWGGYKTNSAAKLASWLAIGCLAIVVVSLLLFGLVLALSSQFAQVVFVR